MYLVLFNVASVGADGDANEVDGDSARSAAGCECEDAGFVVGEDGRDVDALLVSVVSVPKGCGEAADSGTALATSKELSDVLFVAPHTASVLLRAFRLCLRMRTMKREEADVADPNY